MLFVLNEKCSCRGNYALISKLKRPGGVGYATSGITCSVYKVYPGELAFEDYRVIQRHLSLFLISLGNGDYN